MTTGQEAPAKAFKCSECWLGRHKFCLKTEEVNRAYFGNNGDLLTPIHIRKHVPCACNHQGS